jgi:hypothetical protein
MILLVGGNSALLEGLAQAFAITGQRVMVVASLEEASEVRMGRDPSLAVVERDLVARADPGQPYLAALLGASVALVTFREAGDPSRMLAAGVARRVLADLVLPLERNRLLALAEHVLSRARTTGRPGDVTLPESPAS